MTGRAKKKARTLLSEFSRTLGSEILKVRIYRDHGAFVCERELVERDGTSFTMVLPFKEAERAQVLFASDPYYPKVRGQVARVLTTLDRALREQNGERVS